MKLFSHFVTLWVIDYWFYVCPDFLRQQMRFMCHTVPRWQISSTNGDVASVPQGKVNILLPLRKMSLSKRVRYKNKEIFFVFCHLLYFTLFNIIFSLLLPEQMFFRGNFDKPLHVFLQHAVDCTLMLLYFVFCTCCLDTIDKKNALYPWKCSFTTDKTKVNLVLFSSKLLIWTYSSQLLEHWMKCKPVGCSVHDICGTMTVENNTPI